MSQAYYRKWRPQKWDQVVSQEHVVQTLRNAVRSERTGHAYLMAGPRGTGKTTTARLLAKALNCLHADPAERPCDECAHCKSLNEGRFLDLIEIDAASNTSVDDIRDLREKINFSPSQGRYKVYIIDEVHMLSTAAFNALLKTLEEPPPHAVFILATTEVHKIPATILSRVQRYEFKRIPVSEIVKHLKMMAQEEHLKVDDDALQLIARQATGAMRDAISLLDQLASSGGRVTLAEAQAVLGTATSRLVIDLVEALLDEQPAAALHTVQSALDGGADSRQFARQVVDYLRSLLLVKLGSADQVDATREMRQEMASYASRFETARLLDAIRAYNAAAVDARSSWHPGLALELAVVESLAPRSALINTGPEARAEVSGKSAAKPVPQAASSAPAKPPAAELEEPPEEWMPELKQAARPAPAPTPEKSKPQPVAVKSSPQTSASGSKQPPAPVEPARTTPPAGAERAITYTDVQQNWLRIRALVKQRNQFTEAALNSCRYSLKDSSTLILSFQTEVVKSKMETEDNLKILREAIQAILGVRMNIRCVLSGVKSDQPSDLDVDGDGIVGTALDLGGKIVYEE
jgi:DNA polymerase III subunit gamma/tau